MEEMEEIVEETTENAETQTVEEIVEEVEETEEELTDTTEEVEEVKEDVLPKVDVNKIVKARLARERRKHEEELAKYKELELTLKAGMGKDDLDEISTEMKNFYKKQGVEIPEYRYNNERDEKVLAKADAEEIIEAGEEEMERVANEIARKPYEVRTLREKTIFDEVCQRLTLIKSAKDLEKVGVKADILEDKTFKEFAGKFSVSTPITEIYEMYSKVNKTEEAPKKPIGSVKNTTPTNEIKEYYTSEEFDQLTEKDLENPNIFEAVRKSMLKW